MKRSSAASSPTLGIEFDPDMQTVFERFEIVYVDEDHRHHVRGHPHQRRDRRCRGSCARCSGSPRPRKSTGWTPTSSCMPDGSSFAVTPGVAPTEDDRTVGFLVDDLDDARRELVTTGVEVDEEISTNARFRYLHFRAPDGHLYELLEERG